MRLRQTFPRSADSGGGASGGRSLSQGSRTGLLPGFRLSGAVLPALGVLAGTRGCQARGVTPKLPFTNKLLAGLATCPGRKRRGFEAAWRPPAPQSEDSEGGLAGRGHVGAGWGPQLPGSGLEVENAVGQPSAASELNRQKVLVVR